MIPRLKHLNNADADTPANALPLQAGIPRAISQNPLHQLLAEHEAFRATCDELLQLVERLETEGYRASLMTSDVAILLRSRAVIRDHLNVHLVKEEEIFFPRLEKLVPQGRVKFLYLNYDHEYLRDYFEDFSTTVTEFEHHRIPMHRAVADTIRTGRLIVVNLLQHILAEDTVYFQLAEEGFSEIELLEIGQEMAALELRLREH